MSDRFMYCGISYKVTRAPDGRITAFTHQSASGRAQNERALSAEEILPSYNRFLRRNACWPRIGDRAAVERKRRARRIERL
jgi:hypothetical protein